MGQLVSIIAPCYEYKPPLPTAMIAQTYQNWELLLAHDGPNEWYEKYIEVLDDPRIHLLFTEHRYNDYGHSLRDMAFKYLSPESEYLVVTNGDNYYCPSFLQKMVDACGDKDFAWCDLLHNYIDHKVMVSKLNFSEIDCGNFMCRTSLAKKVGWQSRMHAADWEFICSVISLAGGREQGNKAEGIYFVHN
jgi:glycosyltransferase involved in cell wall biosynthesis